MTKYTLGTISNDGQHLVNFVELDADGNSVGDPFLAPAVDLDGVLSTSRYGGLEFIGEFTVKKKGNGKGDTQKEDK